MLLAKKEENLKKNQNLLQIKKKNLKKVQIKREILKINQNLQSIKKSNNKKVQSLLSIKMLNL
jgi:hypothetical protein